MCYEYVCYGNIMLLKSKHTFITFVTYMLKLSMIKSKHSFIINNKYVKCVTKQSRKNSYQETKCKSKSINFCVNR